MRKRAEKPFWPPKGSFRLVSLNKLIHIILHSHKCNAEEREEII